MEVTKPLDSLFLSVLHVARHATECARLNLLYFVTFIISYCNTLCYIAVYGGFLEQTAEHTRKSVESLQYRASK